MKKLLVLGAVSCVAGIVTATAGGCSSETPASSPNEAGATDVRHERSALDSGPEEDAGLCPLQDTLTAADLEAQKGYKPGKSQPSKCTAAEITQFDKNLDDPEIKTWKAVETGLSAECAACIVTSTAEDTWGPVVYTEEFLETKLAVERGVSV